MGLAEDIAYAGGLIDACAATYWRRSVAAQHPSDAGVPLDMQVGPVDDEGWVEWRVLPSTLEEADVAAVEAEFHTRFPPLFRAYLLARFHLLDQVHSRRHGHLVELPNLPSVRPLRPLRNTLRAWQPLLAAGYVPFGGWGDGWGPVCFDDTRRVADGDCPVVWMDHERLVPLGQALGQREAVLPWVQPLYGSFREFLVDILTPAEPGDAAARGLISDS